MNTTIGLGALFVTAISIIALPHFRGADLGNAQAAGSQNGSQDSQQDSQQGGPEKIEQDKQQDGAKALDELFAQAGLTVDLDNKILAARVSIAVTNDPLEYLLVAGHGAAHESLLVTDVDPELYNAAMLALGVTPGQNVQYVEKMPAPSTEEPRTGVDPYTTILPDGDSFYIYAGWTDGEETYFYRIEDLVRDINRMRTMQRHRWVYLGSRMMKRRGTGREMFAATAEGNLINIAFFGAGNTLITAGLAACSDQSIWLPNAWLLPPYQSPVLFILSRKPLESVPENLRAALPNLGGEYEYEDGEDHSHEDQPEGQTDLSRGGR